jgi:hypothetical protein
MVSVAQLVRALDGGSKGCGFETPRSPIPSSSFSMNYVGLILLRHKYAYVILILPFDRLAEGSYLVRLATISFTRLLNSVGRSSIG